MDRMLLGILEVICIGGLLITLNTNKEVLNIQINNIKEVFNSFMCKLLYKEVSQNKYEGDTGLKFESLDEEDDIKDFIMNRPEEATDYYDCSEGMYGQFEDENLFSFSSCRRRIPKIQPKVKMDLQTLATPIEPRQHDYPPIIARHFFGIVEPV